MSTFQVPTQEVELPSKGWFYASTHPLSAGRVSLKYMTAAEEDILTSQNLISKGIVIDKLLESLLATPGVAIDDLLIGDKNALLVASRIFGYGKNYDAEIQCQTCGKKSSLSVNLEELKDKQIEFLESQRGKNEFHLQLPLSKQEITFRFLTHKDELTIRKEIQSLQKGTKFAITKEITTRIRYSVLSVNGDDDREVIRKFVENMPSQDSLYFREYARKISPDVDLSTDFECPHCGVEDRVEVPITEQFFWPNARI